MVTATDCRRRATLYLLGTLVLVGLAAPAAADEFTLSVEPAYPPDQIEDIYKPLVEYLNRETGHTFKLKTYRNHHFHWRDMRNNAPVDFVLEDAHYTDYRQRRAGYVPFAKLAQDTQYSLIAQPDVADRGLDALVGKRIAVLPSPSLGFAMLTQFYRNPVAQPDIRSDGASARDNVEAVFAGEAIAAIVPKFLADQYPNLIAIKTSDPLPGPAISAAPNIDPAVRETVLQALLKLHEDESLYSVLGELGAQSFEAADPSMYAGRDALLRGFFGYAEVAAPPATPTNASAGN